MAEQDRVDRIAEEWARQRSDVDTAGVQVIGRISRLARYLERAIEASLAPRLTSTGFYVLAALRRSGPPYRLSPTELYSHLLVSSGAMTNRLDRLERAGLVSREPAPLDGRSSLVVLTSKGRLLIDRMIERHAANELAMLAGLDARERATLARLLRKLLLSFGDRPEPAADEEARGARPGRG